MWWLKCYSFFVKKDECWKMELESFQRSSKGPWWIENCSRIGVPQTRYLFWKRKKYTYTIFTERKNNGKDVCNNLYNARRVSEKYEKGGEKPFCCWNGEKVEGLRRFTRLWYLILSEKRRFYEIIKPVNWEKLYMGKNITYIICADIFSIYLTLHFFHIFWLQVVFSTSLYFFNIWKYLFIMKYNILFSRYEIYISFEEAAWHSSRNFHSPMNKEPCSKTLFSIQTLIVIS